MLFPGSRLGNFGEGVCAEGGSQGKLDVVSGEPLLCREKPDKS